MARSNAHTPARDQTCSCAHHAHRAFTLACAFAAPGRHLPPTRRINGPAAGRWEQQGADCLRRGGGGGRGEKVVNGIIGEEVEGTLRTANYLLVDPIIAVAYD